MTMWQRLSRFLRWLYGFEDPLESLKWDASMWVGTGTVKSFDRLRCGFIEDDNGHAVLIRFCPMVLVEGMKVSYKIQHSSKGHIAKEINVISIRG